MTDNDEIINDIHKKVIDLHQGIVELENLRIVSKQDKLLAFKFIPGNEKQFVVSGNINGMLTLIRTLVQGLVTYGHTRKKIDTLKFPPETLTNTDYFLTGINIIGNFFEIEKIKIYEPTFNDKMKFWLMHTWKVVWHLVRFALMIIGFFYLIQITFFEK